MPDRTKEELKEIYNDLLEIRKVANKLHKKGYFIAPPWDSDRSAKRKAFFQEFVDEWQRLLINEKITSCECTMKVNSAINLWEEERDKEYNPLRLPKGHGNSHRIRTLNGLSLQQLIDIAGKAIKGDATAKEIKKLNEALDGFGNCHIAEVYEDLDILKEAESLAFDPDQIRISENVLNSPNPNTPSRT